VKGTPAQIRSFALFYGSKLKREQGTSEGEDKTKGGSSSQRETREGKRGPAAPVLDKDRTAHRLKDLPYASRNRLSIPPEKEIRKKTHRDVPRSDPRAGGSLSRPGSYIRLTYLRFPYRKRRTTSEKGQRRNANVYRGGSTQKIRKFVRPRRKSEAPTFPGLRTFRRWGGRVRGEDFREKTGRGGR